MQQGESPPDKGPRADNAAGLSTKGIGTGHNPKARRILGAKGTPSTRARKVFIEALAECGVVLYACEQSGMQRRAAYYLREVDTEFAMAWDAALAESTERLEREAVRRAHDGVTQPVFYKGDECGTVQVYSDRLLEFLLASRDDKYRVRRVEMTGKDGGPINVADEAESIRSKLLHESADSAAASAIGETNGR
jgi:hypothetical protein